MRRVRAAVIVVLALASIGSDALFSQEPSAPRNRRIVVLDGREVVDGEVIVRYRNGAGRAGRERAELQVESDPSEMIGPRGVRRMRSRRMSTRQMLTQLRANPDVELVEPNYVIRANALPNDPSLASQWALVNTGQVVDGMAGTAGADIGAAGAWDMSVGSRANIVAILDTGIDLSHPDLAANLFTAPRQFSVAIGANTITCQPGSHGFNALNDSCVPFDESGHGTHVAGIIGAVGNNNEGITGVNWTANLLPLKILDATGTGSTSDAIKAIDWVIKAKQALGADGNVRVINASWGGPTFSQALNDSIEAANSAGMLFVASAGSDDQNNDVTPHYPASSTASNVISVTAVDHTGKLWAFSNYGPASVDLGAPGGASTLSTLPRSTYGYQSGTSMAAAYVSGAAALVLSRCDMSTSALKTAILSRVRPEATLSGKTSSGGRLDVESALHVCPANPTPSIATISPSSVGAGVPSFTLTVTGSNFTSSSQVRINDSPRATTFVSATQLKATILASDVAAFGTRSISVVNPPPAGGSSSTLTLTVLSGASVTVNGTTGTQSVALGASMTVAVAGGPADKYDWITIAPVGSSDTTYTGIWFLNGSSTPPSTGVSSATFNIPAPSTAGTYEVRFLASGKYIRLATSGSITVGSGGSSAPAPVLTSISPASIAANTAFVLTVAGSGFTSSSQIHINGAARSTTFVSSTSLSASIPAADVATAGSRTITVVTPAPGGGTSSAVTLTVTAASGGAATVTVNGSSGAISVALSASLTVSVANGPADKYDWITIAPVGSSDTTYSGIWFLNGTSTPPSTGSSSATFNIPGPSTAGQYEVRFLGSGKYIRLATSGVITVGSAPPPAPAPVLGSISPASVSANSAFVLTATGSGFTSSSQVHINGAARATTFVSSTTLTASIAAADVATAGSRSITVFTPAPGGGTSSAVTLTVTAPTAGTPTLTVNGSTGALSVPLGASLTVSVTDGPANKYDWITIAPAGSSDTTYSGIWFLNGTSTPPATGVASATFAIPAPTTAGTYEVRFLGSGKYIRLATSGAITVGSAPPPPTPAPVPVLNAISPSSVNANSAFVITVTGSGFTNSSQIQVNGVSRSTSFASSTTLTASIPASDVATAGSRNITVFTPSPGGGTSSAAVLTVVAAAGPTLTVNGSTGDLSVALGASLTVSVADGPANKYDWITIAPVGSSDTTYSGIWFLNGTSTPPSTGVASATFAIPAPTTAGTYEVRFLGSGKYIRLATSGAITVGSAPPPPPPPPPSSGAALTVNGSTGDMSVRVGSSLTVSVANGPGNKYDWITIAPVGSSDTTYSGIWFLNGTSTPPSTGVTSATFAIPAPSTPGTYEVRFLGSGKYIRLATSGAISVTP